jgi:transcriptional regulator NrdR family protein
VDIVKNNSRGSEKFSKKKLHASIVSACLSVRTPVGQAEAIAHTVTNAVTAWLQNKPEVTSQDIRSIAAKHLHSHHPDAAYMYEGNRKVI